MWIHILFVGAGLGACLGDTGGRGGKLWHNLVSITSITMRVRVRVCVCVCVLVPSGWEDELHPCRQGDQTRQGCPKLASHGYCCWWHPNLSCCPGHHIGNKAGLIAHRGDGSVWFPARQPLPSPSHSTACSHHPPVSTLQWHETPPPIPRGTLQPLCSIRLHLWCTPPPTKGGLKCLFSDITEY
jgi:hypothetical protein